MKPRHVDGAFAFLALFQEVENVKRLLPILLSSTLVFGLSPVLPETYSAVSRAMQLEPPKETDKTPRKPDLVEVVKLDSTVHLDIRYATENNFMKRRMYDTARAFLERPAAEALVRVQKKLREFNVGLVVFDAYRPWSVTKKFWDETPPSKRSFVANPRYGSKHNRGCAVDLSLYDLKTGHEIEMPTGYDEFSKRASPGYTGGTERQRNWRDRLRSAMEAEGFRVDEGEWWHFDYKDWRLYPVMDTPL
jgi:D-alanyl-D-alanine dipeptidase